MMMKKINRSKRKGHVKLNVQDGLKVGRTRKNEVWLNFVKIFSFQVDEKRMSEWEREIERDVKEKLEKGPRNNFALAIILVYVSN